MNHHLKMLRNAAEALFYIACSAALASGATDRLIPLFPVIGFGAALIGVALVIKTIIATASSVSKGRSGNVRMALIISLLSVAAVHFSGTPAAAQGMSVSYPASPLFILYYATIVTFALFGRGLPMLAALFVCSGAEILNFLLQDPPGMNGIHDPQWLHRASLRLPPLASMLCAAIGPYLIVVLLHPDTDRGGRLQKKAAAAEPPKSAGGQSRDADRETAAPGAQPKTNFIMTRQEMEETFVEPEEIDNLLSSIVYFMSRNFKAYSSLGFIFDPLAKVFTLNSVHSKSLSINKNVQIPLGKGMVGKLGTDRNPFMSGDLTLYSAELFYYSGNSPINSVLAVPIVSDKLELLGALVIDSQDKQAFKDEHKDTMRRFSHLAAALITNFRMRVYQERAAKNFRIFYEASQQFIPALHMDQVFDVLMIMIEQVAACTRIMAVGMNGHEGLGTVHKIRGTSPDLREGFRFEINEGLYSYAFQKAKVVNIPDFQHFRGKYFRFSADEAGGDYIRSLIIIPMMSDTNQVSAVLSVESSEPNQFQGEMETILYTLVSNAAVALNRARLYRQMELLAITDGLTQLINHKHFQVLLEKEIERSKRYKRPVSLLIMDIDHFKSFNDTYGHPVGDLVLKEIAQSIREKLRVNDSAARYGGEEFAVIIPENDERGALQTGERIRQTIEQKIIKSGNDQLRVTISIGCASFPAHAGTQRDLIERADKALYHSKRTGRNRVSVYVKEMESEKEK
jgi:diguanylate cyclase (GGDEF)-like protein